MANNNKTPTAEDLAKNARARKRLDQARYGQGGKKKGRFSVAEMIKRFWSY
jgi:hypothetical protein